MMLSTLLNRINEKFFNHNLSLTLLILNFNRDCDTIPRKWTTYKSCILNNTLITPDIKKNFMFVYCYAQKIIFAINKLKHVWKYKKYKTFDNDYDLNFVSLSKYPDDMKIELIEDDTKYIFTLYDIIKLINNGLCNSEYMNPKPRHPMNPYTNTPISHHNIYNIFISLLFHSKFRNMRTHILSYYQCNLNLKRFYEENRIMLKKTAVRHYIDTEDVNSLFEYVCEMFEDYDDVTSIILHRATRKKQKYIDDTKHLLFIYLFLQQISTGDDIYSTYNGKLIIMLKKFEQMHPRYGRMHVTRLSRMNHTNIYSYDAETVVQNHAPVTGSGGLFDSFRNNRGSLYNIPPPITPPIHASTDTINTINTINRVNTILVRDGENNIIENSNPLSFLQSNPFRNMLMENSMTNTFANVNTHIYTNNEQHTNHILERMMRGEYVYGNTIHNDTIQTHDDVLIRLGSRISPTIFDNPLSLPLPLPLNIHTSRYNGIIISDVSQNNQSCIDTQPIEDNEQMPAFEQVDTSMVSLPSSIDTPSTNTPIPPNSIEETSSTDTTDTTLETDISGSVYRL